ncbi:stage II sporulation protein R [Paenibacillus crassostreae]|uniref:Stage II sporulation protein R n=1 Tax=Paenibacillus crassostreae TaxID=1763538 RepID=A0A167BH97_9BACL|nr:stage II sporulation protein R [Paenibacillus crassostreae]AOZ94721.1 stage II sporulation protein R [Paenibacillus crassostreae]OAB72069.1 stage II sporulation protein R [Paenibacillus crassostreae]
MLRLLFKNTAIIFSMLFMLVMSWDGQRIDASVAEGSIPEESIRLRILANSDSVNDQLVKREIRDAIIAEMNGWVEELDNPQNLDQARETIRNHMADLNNLVGQELSDRGISYSYHVELSVVPFPTKLYGGTVYPAGEYEALRVTLGAGRGQNWWCVLFPPLCFIDAGSGDAIAQSAEESAQVKETGNSDNVTVKQVPASTDEAPEVRFFLWDLLSGFVDWIKGLF